MARVATPAPKSKEVALNEAAVNADRQAANQLAVLARTDAKNVTALAAELGYQGPLAPDALEHLAKSRLIAAQQSIFEFGASLLLLREACLHGDWQERIDRIGVSQPTAFRYMSIAAKFKGSSVAKALAHLGMGKVLELTALETEEVEAFAKGESVRGLTVDKAQTMTLKELRAALKDREAEVAAKEKLLDKKDKKIRQLEHRIERSTPDEAFADFLKEAGGVANEVVALLRGSLRQALLGIRNAAADGADNSVLMAGLVGQVQADLTALREEFDLPDVSNARDAQLAAEMEEWAGKGASTRKA